MFSVQSKSHRIPDAKIPVLSQELRTSREESIMQRCPRCGETKLWRLGDGRLKCQGCGLRYSDTSAWDSIRLPEEAKQHLLEHFALGDPAYRLREAGMAAPASRERFNRVVRACCTLAGGIGALPRQAGERSIAFDIAAFGEHIEIQPAASTDPAEEQAVPHDGLLRLDANHGRLLLRPHGQRIAMRSTAAPPREPDDLVGRFWDHAREWLRPYRGIPQRYFTLYLGEACFRFNHRDEDLVPLLLDLMKSTPIFALRPLLDAPAEAEGHVP